MLIYIQRTARLGGSAFPLVDHRHNLLPPVSPLVHHAEHDERIDYSADHQDNSQGDGTATLVDLVLVILRDIPAPALHNLILDLFLWQFFVRAGNIGASSSAG